MAYREVQDLNEVDIEKDVDFRYNHSMYIRDQQAMVFYARMFSTDLKAAYTSIDGNGESAEISPAAKHPYVRLNGDKVVLFKANGEQIVIITSDVAEIALHNKTDPAPKTESIVQPSNSDDAFVVTLTKLDQKNRAGVFVSRRRIEELLPKLNARGLLAEYGHPLKLVGMMGDEWARRIMTIELDHVCCRLSQFRIEQIDGTWCLTAAAAPSGYFRDAFKAMMATNPEAYRFGLRCTSTDTFVHDVVHREMRDIIAFDFIENREEVAA